MENHLVSDSNRNTKSIIPHKVSKERQTMLGHHLVLVTLFHNSQVVLSKTIRIG